MRPYLRNNEIEFNVGKVTLLLTGQGLDFRCRRIEGQPRCWQSIDQRFEQQRDPLLTS